MEFNKYRVQKVQLQSSDPNERYYWVIFDEKLIKDNKKGWYASSSMIYDTTEKKLYAWTLFPNRVNILDGYVEKLEAELAVNTAGVYVGASFVADYWSDVLKAVVATFGTYEATNTVTNLSDPNGTGVTSCTPFEYTVECHKSSVSQDFSIVPKREEAELPYGTVPYPGK